MSRFLRIIAAFSFLMLSGVLLIQVSLSDRALGRRYFREAAMHVRSPLYDGVAGLIDRKKYERAIELLQQSSSADPLARHLLAEALTKNEQFPEAIALYKELVSDPENLNREGAEFMLALIYLQLNQDQTAEAMIAKMAENEFHDYRFEARKLQAQLKVFWRKII